MRNLVALFALLFPLLFSGENFVKGNNLLSSHLNTNNPAILNYSSTGKKNINAPLFVMDNYSVQNIAQSAKMKLDSLITHFRDNTSGIWLTDDKMEFTFNDKGFLTVNITSEWDNTTGKWIGSHKEEFNYGNDHLTQYIDYYLDNTTGEWVFDNKEEFSYDTNGNMTQYIAFEWQVSSSQWIATSKMDFSYNANNKVIQYIHYSRDEITGKWVTSYKGDYAYNPGGAPIRYVGAYYDLTTVNWINDYKGEFSYNTYGWLTQYIDYYWNTSTKQWVSDGKYEYQYNNEGNLTQSVEYYWESMTKRWISNGKQEYIYDSSANMTQYTEFYWKQTGGGWTPTYKEGYTYDNTYGYDDLIVPTLYEDANRMAFNHMRLTLNSYQWDGLKNQWNDYTKGTFFYSAYYPEQDAPVAADDTFTISEDSILTASVSPNDKTSKNEPNTWEIVEGNGPYNGNIIAWEPANGKFSYKPNPDYAGSDWFFYRLCDGNHNCDTARVDITVNPVNDLPFPVGSIPDYQVQVGQIIAVSLNPEPGVLFDDVDSNDVLILTVSMKNGEPLPDFMTYKNDTLFVKPLPAKTGCYTLQVVVTDTESASASLAFNICVIGNAVSASLTSEDYSGFRVFPNPSNGRFTLDMLNTPNDEILLQIFSANGQLLLNKTLTDRQTVIDLTDKARDVYFIRIIKENEVYFSKIVIY